MPSRPRRCGTGTSLVLLNCAQPAITLSTCMLRHRCERSARVCSAAACLRNTQAVYWATCKHKLSLPVTPVPPVVVFAACLRVALLTQGNTFDRPFMDTFSR
jgi:hypothetical protein